MLEEYKKIKLIDEESFILKKKLDQLKKVDAFIFDVDGTLINVRNSYNRVISKTVAFLVEGFTGCGFSESLISDEIIFMFRNQGGFNDDWDIVYGILMHILSELPSSLQKKIIENLKETKNQMSNFKLFFSLKSSISKCSDIDLTLSFFQEVVNKLKKFTERLNETGTKAVDNIILNNHISLDSRIFYYKVKNIVNHPNIVGKSLIATIFEEIFCGDSLFQDIYKMKSRFNKGSGMIEKGEIIIKTPILNQLVEMVGGKNIGVASGSKFISTKQILGEILERFNSEALIFADDVEEAEQKHSETIRKKTVLKKPNPFSLKKSAEALNSCSYILYVGDTMADALMVKKANETSPNFLFAGVYRYADSQKALLKSFFNSKCDLILPSVNELPSILKEIIECRN